MNASTHVDDRNKSCSPIGNHPLRAQARALWPQTSIDIESRRVHIAGFSNQPSGAWMAQIARNLTDSFDGFLPGTRYLVLDRDPLHTRAFRSTLGASGVKVVRLPSRSPNLNAFAERFVLSVKSECLDRVIPLSERHLRHVLAEYVEHYHQERNHRPTPGAAPWAIELLLSGGSLN